MLFNKIMKIFTKSSYLFVIIALVVSGVSPVCIAAYNNSGTDVIVYANSSESTEPEDDLTAWNLSALNSEYAHSSGYTGEGVKICIVDSGIDIYSEVYACGGVDLEDPEYCNGDDLTGHGSAVAGIIAASDDGSGTVGIAPDAQIYNVRVLDGANQAPVSRIIDALDWCIANNMDIVNMSFGTDEYSPALKAKIEDVSAHGIIMISSAGNGETVQYPAAFPEVISVSSVNSSMQKPEGTATGDFSAPGINIYSTSLLGGYCAVSGSSIAAAHITGCAAVLLGIDTSKSAEFINDLLIYSCKELGNSSDYGCGIPDLEFALTNYDTFAAGYSENDNYVSANTSATDDYSDEDCFVEGQWDNSGHAEIIDYYYDSTNFNIRFPTLIKKVSNSMDSRDYLREHYIGYSDSPSFHATGNYVITAKLLYEIATNYKVYGVSQFSHDSNSSFSQNDYDYYKCYRYSDLSHFLGGDDNYKKIMVNITDMLNKYDNTTLSNENKLPGETDFVTISEKTSTIVMGMFLHLLGDLYAHRTVVPPSASKIKTCKSHTDNEGRYFIKSDFNDVCAKEHVITVEYSGEKVLSERVNYYHTMMLNAPDLITKIIFLSLYIIWQYFENLLFNNENHKIIKPKQEKEDKNLLKYSQNIPANESTGKICQSLLCYDALIRINSLGILQFKDIKYFLKEKKDKTEFYNINRSYYEDPTSDNMFYLRRKLAAKASTKLFCSDFYNSTSSQGIVTFKPIQLLPRSTESGTNIRSFWLKLDCFYNYLKDFDDMCPPDKKSNVLIQSYWNSVNDNLFRYTTIYTNEGYYVDPSTYTSDDKQCMIYRSSALIKYNNYSSCDDFYNS